MLLGKAPYQRLGAPEPRLLACLVPLLPDAVLERAIYGVAGAGLIWERERVRLLGALLARAVDAGRESGIRVRDPVAEMVIHFPAVVPLLPISAVDAALAAVRSYGGGEEERRATALAMLLARSAKPRLEDVLSVVRAPAAYGDRQRAPAVAAAIARLSRPLSQGAMAQLLSTIAVFEKGGDRGYALAALASHLEGEARGSALEGALQAFRADPERTSERILALVELSQQFPEPRRFQMLDSVLDEARDELSGSERALALARIAERVGGSLAQELEREIHTLDVDDGDLFALAAYLSEAQLERALEVLPRARGWLEGALAELAPHLPPDLLAAALEREWPDASLAAVLKTLAPHLDETLSPRALEIARGLESAWEKGRVLAALLPVLPLSLRAEVGPEASSYADARICELWAQLAPGAQRALAADLIDALRGAYGGAEETTPPHETVGPITDPDHTGRDLQESKPESGEHEALSLRTAEKHLVNTGFSLPSQPGQPLSPVSALAPARKHLFWFQVGDRVEGRIDTGEAALPADKLPPHARLSVVLYTFPEGIEIEPGADVGEIQLQPDRSVRVVRPVRQPTGLRDGDPLDGARCLFYPIRTPSEPGTYRLRCNVYYEHVLVQSHLVQATVGARQRDHLAEDREGSPQALRTTCDYTLSNTLATEGLTRLQPHRLSIMLNENGDGTHGFRFFGADEAADQEFKQDATLTGLELQNLIDVARAGLREAAWGDAKPWDEGKRYRYEGGLDGKRVEQLRADLAQLAKRGYRFYDATISRLAGGKTASRSELRALVAALRRLMRRPGGLIQIASKESLQQVVPLALFYDHPLDSTAKLADYRLCPDFVRALGDGTPLLESVCFLDGCPSQSELTVVCPSGFWGYRHNIGMPVSIGGSLAEAVTEIEIQATPHLTVAVSTDLDKERRDKHEKALQGLRQDLGWHHADTRAEALALMETAPSHVVYFYCHGGITEDRLPYIQVGPKGERGITSDLMRALDLFWTQPQPLVFINGCHTTALEPEAAFSLVRGFVETAGAAGVIGTEITVFEQMAVVFGETCLRHFYDGVPLGESVRRARLKLLEEGNPLGLVYDSFAVASLAMVQRA
jgi:hypothetical protein